MSTDAQKAREAIRAGLEAAGRDTLARMLCSLYGHPPVVTVCFGYVHCARCDDLLGDRLGRVYDLTDRAVLAHAQCEECQTVLAGLTDEQRLLTKLEEEKP